MDPDLMERVQVRWQGDAILSGPSEYWTSVINAGRQCSLEMIRNALPPGDGLDSASQVLASIMHVGDVLALAGSGAPATLCCSESEEPLHQLATRYVSKCDMAAPALEVVEKPALRLRGEGEGPEAEADLFITDMQADVNKKIKKAFSEPGNATFCPPLSWVRAVLLPLNKEFVVSRKPDNGGDKTYTSAEDLQVDYASGDLHPGDLKPAVGKALNAVLGSVRPGLKTNVLKTAQKKLAAYVKAKHKQKSK
uniref:tyrosine--tRNA ligase n=1 Tax=Alexandrium catenella TaxID=2925 RepID=A0A7S1S1C9_ALECA